MKKKKDLDKIMAQKAHKAEVDSMKAHRRRELLMPNRVLFDRCPGKDYDKVLVFEMNGEMRHSGSSGKHICEICRCSNVAGSGTEHYGSGFCASCEATTSQKNNESINRQHEKILRKRGLGLTARELRTTLVVDRANSDQIEAVTLAANRATKVLDSFIEDISSGKMIDTEVIERLDKILKLLETTDDPDNPGIEDAVMHLEDMKAYMSYPTEYVSGVARIMSDKSRISAANNLLKTMSTVGLAELRKQGMVPKSYIYVFLNSLAQVTQKVAQEELGSNAKIFIDKWMDRMTESMMRLRGS